MNWFWLVDFGLTWTSAISNFGGASAGWPKANRRQLRCTPGIGDVGQTAFRVFFQTLLEQPADGRRNVLPRVSEASRSLTSLTSKPDGAKTGLWISAGEPAGKSAGASQG